jgi:hypothetical protein
MTGDGDNHDGELLDVLESDNKPTKRLQPSAQAVNCDFWLLPKFDELVYQFGHANRPSW